MSVPQGYSHRIWAASTRSSSAHCRVQPHPARPTATSASTRRSRRSRSRSRWVAICSGLMEIDASLPCSCRVLADSLKCYFGSTADGGVLTISMLTWMYWCSLNQADEENLFLTQSSYCVALSIFKLLEALVKLFTSSWNLVICSYLGSWMCMQNIEA